MRIHTGNGGGCGKPELRDKSLIEEDLLNEYITLEQAKKLGDELVVGLNSDSSVKILKGKNRPINNLEHRFSLLCSV